MPKFKFHNIKVSGISSVVPTTEKSLLDDKTLYDGNEKKINRVINSSGFLKRRVADANTTTADLCEYAANNLINNLKIDRESIEAIIFVSYTPDYLMPATSYVLHKKLKLSKDCIVMDIPQACSGYVIGLLQAATLINSGLKKVLLLVGDTFSKFSDMFINKTAPIFGDAGSATLVEYDEKSEETYFNVNSDGSNYDALICKNGGFRYIPQKDMFYEDNKFQYLSSMDGGRIFDFTMNNIAPSINELFKYANLSISDIDYYIMHQANRFILENLARQLGIDIQKMPMSTLSKYGNQCGASIPCTISDILKEEFSQNNQKVMLCGFGVGLSWASCIININNIYCSPVLNFKGA